MLGHSSITITADTYTSLLPETDLAIAEAAARLVPRARGIRGNEDSEAELRLDKTAASGAEPVLDGAVGSGETPEPGALSAHAPLTQTAPDVGSEAE